MNRCFGNREDQPLYASYHDHEWGRPQHNDHHLFEMLVLEGAQAGLNWYTVLRKREAYRLAFHRFDPKKVASMSDRELQELLTCDQIIRNRLKIFSARTNGRVVIELQKEFGSFDNYLWAWVNHQPIVNHFRHLKEIPSHTDLSDALSKDLKRRGMSFVGSTIIYAFMQAVGLVNDHLIDCHCRKKSP